MLVRNRQFKKNLMARRPIQLPEVLKALQEINDEILSSDGLSGILNRIVDSARRIFHAESCYIQCYDSVRGQYFPIVASGLSKGWTHADIRRPEGIGQRAVKEGRPFFTRNVDDLNPKVVAEGITWGGAFPLQPESQKEVGILYLHFASDPLFDEEDTNILELFALRAGIATQIANLWENDERMLRELNALRDATWRIANTSSLRESLQTIVKAAKQVMSADVAVLYPWDEDREAVNQSLLVADGLDLTQLRVRRPRREGMYFQVMKEGMLHVQDIDAIPADQIELLQVTREDTLSVFDLKSFVAVAMRSGEENLGILFVASRKPSVLEEDKQKAIQTLAYQAATCMQLADLAQTREKAAQAEAMNFVNSSAAQFAHRLSNVAGTIPLIVRDLRKKIMEAGVTDDRVLRRFDDLANDTTMLMEMADYLRIPQDIGPLAPVDVQKTIDRAIDKARLTDINSSIRLTCDIQTDLPPVTGCETLVEDILVNLLHNAVEAKAENVQLTASRDPQTWKVVLKVIDDGVGIHESDCSKLFTPFYSTKKASLHGIGLWASRASLTRMNGQLQVQSELNKGTTMTVTLPASDEK